MRFHKFISALYLYGITDDGVYVVKPETYNKDKNIDSTLRVLGIGNEYLMSLSKQDWKIYCHTTDYTKIILYSRNYIVVPIEYSKTLQFNYGKIKIGDDAVYMYSKKPIYNVCVVDKSIVFYEKNTIQISPTNSVVPCIYKHVYVDTSGTLTSLGNVIAEGVDEIIYSDAHTHFIIVRKEASIYLIHSYIKASVDITKVFEGNPRNYKIQASLTHIIFEYNNDFCCIILTNDLQLKLTRRLSEMFPEVYSKIKDPSKIRIYQGTEHTLVTVADTSYVYEVIYISPPQFIKTKSLLLKST